MGVYDTKTISQLEQIDALTDETQFALDLGGQTLKTTMGQMKSYIADSGKQTTNGFIGQLIYGIRIDEPAGYMRMDGVDRASDKYPELVENYLLKFKIKYLTIAEWDAEAGANEGNCGDFAYDPINRIIRPPRLTDRVFIAQALTTTQNGKYNGDQIRNINGEYYASMGTFNYMSGAFAAAGQSAGTNMSGVQTGNGRMRILLDASNVVPTGDYNQPRHIQYPLFICVDTVAAGIDPTIYAKDSKINTEIVTRTNSDMNLQDQINTINTQLAGATSSKVFNSKAALDLWLLDPANKLTLKVGDILLIRDVDSPDYRWYGTSYEPAKTQKIDLTEYYDITTTDELLSHKVDAIAGMGLSTNDLTDTLLDKLLDSVDSTTLNSAVSEVNNAIEQVADDVATLGTDLNGEIATIKETYATAETDGLQTKENFSQVVQNTQDIAQLQGSAKLLRFSFADEFDTDTPTEQQFEDYLDGLGYEYASVRITNMDTTDVWVYDTINELFVNKGQDTINLATNTTAGVVVGREDTTANDGGINIEADGSMWVNGWATLKTAVSTAVNNLITHIADTVKHVTADERTTWNAKQAKTAGAAHAIVACASTTAGDLEYIGGTAANQVLMTNAGAKSSFHTVTTTPTSGSAELVTSGGVYTALALKADKSTTYTKTEIDSKLLSYHDHFEVGNWGGAAGGRFIDLGVVIKTYTRFKIEIFGRYTTYIGVFSFNNIGSGLFNKKTILADSMASTTALSLNVAVATGNLMLYYNNTDMLVNNLDVRITGCISSKSAGGFSPTQPYVWTVAWEQDLLS